MTSEWIEAKRAEIMAELAAGAIPAHYAAGALSELLRLAVEPR